MSFRPKSLFDICVAKISDKVGEFVRSAEFGKTVSLLAVGDLGLPNVLEKEVTSQLFYDLRFKWNAVYNYDEDDNIGNNDLNEWMWDEEQAFIENCTDFSNGFPVSWRQYNSIHRPVRPHHFADYGYNRNDTHVVITKYIVDFNYHNKLTRFNCCFGCVFMDKHDLYRKGIRIVELKTHQNVPIGGLSSIVLDTLKYWCQLCLRQPLFVVMNEARCKALHKRFHSGKRKLDFDKLDGVGDSIRYIKLNGCFVNETEVNSLSYEDMNYDTE